MTDSLIRRIIERDESALSELYTAFGARVFGVALHVLQDPKLAEEVTQDTFLKIWANAHKWMVERGSVSAWVLTIARYTAIDLLRRERHQAVNGEQTALEPLDEMLITVEHSEMTFAKQNADMLKALICQLPGEQIEAIELAFFKGMTHSEIADHLREPLGTIKSRIRNGLKTLKGMWIAENM
ncbi:MAG: sigma-70 family RNA polymerase sigma factor [Anaerolineae bacterium]